MCRLAYISKNFKSLPAWLFSMEKSFGGDGTGIASPEMGMVKRTDMNWQESYELLAGRGELPVLWHTRKVSSGKKEDRLCHPFECFDGYLAHNGHWHTGDVAARAMKDINGGDLLSDTAFFSLLVNQLGFCGAVERYEPSGVWLHMDKSTGELAVWKNGGSLHYCRKLNSWGSEPAPQGEWFPVKDGFYDYGERPRKPVEPKKKETYVGGLLWDIDPVTGKLICPKRSTRPFSFRSAEEEMDGLEDGESGKLPWWQK